MTLKGALEKAMTKNPEAGERILEMLAEADREAQKTVLTVIEMPEHPAPDDGLARDAARMERRERIYQSGVREGHCLISCIRTTDPEFAPVLEADRELDPSKPYIEIMEYWVIEPVPLHRVVEAYLLFRWGWHTTQVIKEFEGPGSQLLTTTITGLMLNGELVLLKPGVYPQDYPQDIDPEDIAGPVLSHPGVWLAVIDESLPTLWGSSRRVPRPVGYDEITIGKRRYYFHSSKAGVEALFQLTGVRLLASRLMVRPGQAGDWIGREGFNAKRLAKLLGLRYLKVVDIAADQ